MPVYTFGCSKCQQNVEVEHGFNQPHPKRHKGCGGTLKRTFNMPQVVFKGAGFYSTDKRLDTPPDGNLE